MITYKNNDSKQFYTVNWITLFSILIFYMDPAYVNQYRIILKFIS